MTVRLTDWYGRLGNNIQQIANAILIAKENETNFTCPFHPNIEPFDVSFGNNSYDYNSKCFYWEGPYREVNLGTNFIYKNMREVCRDIIYPQLKIPDVAVDEDTLVIHIRSGDVFNQDLTNPEMYAPNPLYFYLELLKGFKRAIVVTENDDYNPIVRELSYRDKVAIQKGSVEEDFGILLGAKHLANSGVGTFGIAAALCSNKVKHFYCSPLAIGEHLNWTMLRRTDVSIHLLQLPNYLRPGQWRNSDEQRQYILDYQA